MLIVDARHRPTEADRQMADWYRGSGMDFLVAANKMDKLKKANARDSSNSCARPWRSAKGQT